MQQAHSNCKLCGSWYSYFKYGRAHDAVLKSNKSTGTQLWELLKMFT